MRSKKLSGALGVDTITIQGFDLAMHLSDTSGASCCCPGGKNSASSKQMNETFVRPLIYLGDAMDKPLQFK